MQEAGLAPSRISVFYDAFYQKLFEKIPAAKHLFDGNMVRQSRALVKVRTFYVLSCAHMLRVVVSCFVRRSLLTVCMYVRKTLGELVVWMAWGVGRANVVFFVNWGTNQTTCDERDFDDRCLWSINELTLSLYVVLTAIHQDSAARFTSGTSSKIRAR